MIPKTIHIVWVGDESKRPDNCINTWIEKNPTWSVRIWGNAERTQLPWLNKNHMEEMAKYEWCGVADLMRWEILYNEGGFAVDADSICIKPLQDWLLEHEMFASWENEIARPGLIANGYVGARPKNRLVGQILLDINAEKTVVNRKAWLSTGPMRLTETWKRNQYQELSILPSHYFIPNHFERPEYAGSGHVFAKQFWGATSKNYDDLHLRIFE
jgi:mannosyltransferase OCH1-like enzyme